jgi:hypothetical protein
MVYGYAVKYNGKIYPSGTDVPEGEVTETEKLLNDIKKMNRDALVAKAVELGIEVIESDTKAVLIEKISDKIRETL